MVDLFSSDGSMSPPADDGLTFLPPELLQEATLTAEEAIEQLALPAHLSNDAEMPRKRGNLSKSAFYFYQGKVTPDAPNCDLYDVPCGLNLSICRLVACLIYVSLWTLFAVQWSNMSCLHTVSTPLSYCKHCCKVIKNGLSTCSVNTPTTL